MHTPKKAARFADVTPLPTLPPTPRQPIGHVIKSWRDSFDDVYLGRRAFEVRRDDRDYAPGDTVVLVEYDRDTKEHTGRSLTRVVGNLFRGKPFPEGICAFELRYGEGPAVQEMAGVCRR